MAQTDWAEKEAKISNFVALFDNPDDIDPDEFKARFTALGDGPWALNAPTRAYLQALENADSEDQVDTVIALLDPEIAARLFRDPPHSQWIALMLGDTSEPERLERVFREACDCAPDTSGPHIILVQLLEYWGRPEVARAFIDEHPKIFEDPVHLLSLGENVEIRPAERARVERYIETLGSDASSQLRAKALRWQLLHSDWQAAESEARRLDADSPGDEHIGGIFRQLIDAPASETQLKALDESGEILLGHNPGDHCAVIIFSGIDNQTLLRTGTFYRYLASLGATALIVRDSRRLNYVRGLRSLAPDLDGTIVRLREIVSDLGIEKISTFGLSAGGFGAIVYGLLLRARATLCFSPPSTMSPDIAEFDTRGSAFRRRIARALDEKEWDLLTWLDESSHSLPIAIYFGEDHPQDPIHAARLGDRPGVTLHPMKGVSTHSPIMTLRSPESLLKILAEGLAIPAS
ncbi:MAG: hypothetical protein ABR601_00590 [Parasphingopyxis sp.]|nr:hypothetical protein [Sphingomonadales bacterium]